MPCDCTCLTRLKSCFLRSFLPRSVKLCFHFWEKKRDEKNMHSEQDGWGIRVNKKHAHTKKIWEVLMPTSRTCLHPLWHAKHYLWDAYGQATFFMMETNSFYPTSHRITNYNCFPCFTDEEIGAWILRSEVKTAAIICGEDCSEKGNGFGLCRRPRRLRHRGRKW